MIKNALITGYMPPWGAHERHRGEFKDERYIEDAELATLVAWVDGGALEGKPSDAAALSTSMSSLDASSSCLTIMMQTRGRNFFMATITCDKLVA